MLFSCMIAQGVHEAVLNDVSDAVMEKYLYTVLV